MQITRKILSLTMGGAIVLGMAGAAMAAPAVATGNVNVRSGPSAGYDRVDTLRRNEIVDVTGCRGGWCFVEKRGPDGWVSANYLQPVRQQSSKPSVNFSFSFGNPPVVRPPRQPDRGDWNNGPGRGPDRGDWNNGPGRGPDRGGWNGNNGGNWDDRGDRDNGPRFNFGN